VRVYFTGGGTGGHLYPALAIARALVRRRGDVEPFFIGATRGIERDVLPTTEFPHLLLDLHPMYRGAPWRNWRTVRGLVAGGRRVAALAARDHPPLIVATGGYASGATLAAAVTRGIPYVVQEQNSSPGRTVRLFARWAREVYVGFPESIAGLPAAARRRAFDTGNPVEPPPSPRPDRTAARRAWGIGADVERVVLVFGGSQGSAALNALVDAWIGHGLPRGLAVIWATGKAHFARHAALAGPRVILRPYLAPIADAYAAADLALTRAGAMTTAELCAWGIPMVLIPLPTAAADHQTANARALANAGAARWLPQAEATVERLAVTLAGLLADPAQLTAAAAAAAARGRPEASLHIADRLLALLARTAP
jgi:UDP-N-acetylglucosamine--N-acetylmuramyl-(pentapeptide) pyrophosphoryl-undecaprenol N-acetylglucosamine transferase